MKYWACKLIWLATVRENFLGKYDLLTLISTELESQGNSKIQIIPVLICTRELKKNENFQKASLLSHSFVFLFFNTSSSFYIY